MNSSAKPFVLLDLDGTLLRPGCRLQRLHMAAMAEAIAAVTGHNRSFEYKGHELRYAGASLAGFTDAGTIRVALGLDGVPENELARLVPEVMVDMTERLINSPVDPDRPAGQDLLPGARSILAQLEAAGCILGMSTGNARAVAIWKMRQVGLDGLLHDGGFGDRASDRREVVADAVAAVATGIDPRHGLLIGDTVGDVTAAHAAGLRCLAVSTGNATTAELTASGADEVITSLDEQEVITTVWRLTGSDRAVPVTHSPAPD